jgi:excisionase family DNA binding protein
MSETEILGTVAGSVTVASAAERLGVSEATVRRWATVGFNGVTLQALRVGKRRRFTLAAIAAFLAATGGVAA